MTALAVFDIEAVPDIETARRLFARPDEMPAADIRRMLDERYARDGADPATAFFRFRSTGSSPSPPSTPSGRMAAVLGR
jgi:hypothetical protein